MILILWIDGSSCSVCAILFERVFDRPRAILRSNGDPAGNDGYLQHVSKGVSPSCEGDEAYQPYPQTSSRYLQSCRWISEVGVKRRDDGEKVGNPGEQHLSNQGCRDTPFSIQDTAA